MENMLLIEQNRTNKRGIQLHTFNDTNCMQQIGKDCRGMYVYLYGYMCINICVYIYVRMIFFYTKNFSC